MAVFVADEQSVKVDVHRLRRVAHHVLETQRVPDAMELNVLCVDKDVSADLNARHMGGRGPTDVLAFPMDMPGETMPGEPTILGDVVLCPEVAVEQAGQHRKSAAAELDMLLVHGLLHLLGHDHAEPAERVKMFELTDTLLNGLADPSRTAGQP